MTLRTKKDAHVQAGVALIEAGRACVADSLDTKQAQDAAAMQQAASAVAQDAKLFQGGLPLRLS